MVKIYDTLQLKRWNSEDEGPIKETDPSQSQLRGQGRRPGRPWALGFWLLRSRSGTAAGGVKQTGWSERLRMRGSVCRSSTLSEIFLMSN